MTRPLPWIAAAVLFTLTACGGSESSQSKLSASLASLGGGASGAPRVEAAHQKTIDEAWVNASAGKSPANDCARIKGHVIGTKTAEGSRKALAACNVEIPVHYFLTQLDRVEKGEQTCHGFMMGMMTQLPAMTMDMSGLAGAVERGGVSKEDAPAAAGNLIAGAMSGGTGEPAADDPKRLIKERIADRTRTLCPDIVSALQL
jgi:hypothetical protein